MVSFACSGSKVGGKVGVIVAVGVKVDVEVGAINVGEETGVSTCVGIFVELAGKQPASSNVITRRRDKQFVDFIFGFFFFY